MSGGVPDRRPAGARPKHRSRRDGKPRLPARRGRARRKHRHRGDRLAPDAVETIVPAETNASATATAAAAAAASKPASKLPAAEDGPRGEGDSHRRSVRAPLAGAVAPPAVPRRRRRNHPRGPLLVENHIPGVGIIEDLLGLLAAVQCTCGGRRLSATLESHRYANHARAHLGCTSSRAAVALAAGLYGVVLERVYRESSGWG